MKKLLFSIRNAHKACKSIAYGLLFGLLFAAASMLTSCEDELGLWDFVVPPESVTEKALHIDPDAPEVADEQMRSLLDQHPHRETIDSADLESSTAVPDGIGYVALPFLPGKTVEEATALLTEAGLSYTTVTQTNPVDAGVVFAVDYAGVGANGTHYINPVIPIALSVSAEKPVYPEATEYNTVYLTFDDGPDAYTEEILDILDSYGIKATFFLIGDSAKKYPEAVKAIYNRGHDVACHSMSHKYESIYQSADSLMTEVSAWVDLMEGLGVDFDLTPKLFRYPGGSKSSYLNAQQRQATTEQLTASGFRIYDWNVVANDALLFQCPEDTSVYSYIRETFVSTFETRANTAGPKILLLHEAVAETRVVLPRILDYLIEQGCTFAPLSDLEENWVFSAEETA